MMEGYLKHLAKTKAEIYSAGIEVHGVNPKAILYMKEDGIDLSNHTSNHIDEYRNIDFDYIITVCDHAQEHCPYFPSKAKRMHQNFPDPAKAHGTEAEIEQAFRSARNEIKSFAEKFVMQYL